MWTIEDIPQQPTDEDYLGYLTSAKHAYEFQRARYDSVSLAAYLLMRDADGVTKKNASLTAEGREEVPVLLVDIFRARRRGGDLVPSKPLAVNLTSWSRPSVLYGSCQAGCSEFMTRTLGFYVPHLAKSRERARHRRQDV